MYDGDDETIYVDVDMPDDVDWVIKVRLNGYTADTFVASGDRNKHYNIDDELDGNPSNIEILVQGDGDGYGWEDLASEDFKRETSAPTYDLDVEVSPRGSGTVTVTPDNDDYSFDQGVVLEAHANEGYTFDRYESDEWGTSYDGSCYGEHIREDVDVIAYFNAATPPDGSGGDNDDQDPIPPPPIAQEYSIRCYVVPPEAGMLVISASLTPEDIIHSSDYTSNYRSDTVLTIRSVESTGYSFMGWAYNDIPTSTDDIYNLTPVEDADISAIFTKDQPAPPGNGHQSLIDGLRFHGDDDSCVVFIYLIEGNDFFSTAISTNSGLNLKVGDIDVLLERLSSLYKNVTITFEPQTGDTGMLRIDIVDNPTKWEAAIASTTETLSDLAQYLSGQCNFEDPGQQEDCRRTQMVLLGVATVLTITPVGGLGFVYLGYMGLAGNTYLLVSDASEAALTPGFDQDIHDRIITDVKYSLLSLFDVAGGNLIDFAKIKLVTKYPKLNNAAKITKQFASNATLRARKIGGCVVNVFDDIIMENLSFTDDFFRVFDDIIGAPLGNSGGKALDKFTKIFGDIKIQKWVPYKRSISEMSGYADDIARNGFDYSDDIIRGTLKGDLLEEYIANVVASGGKVVKVFKNAGSATGKECVDIIYTRLDDAGREVIGIMEVKLYETGGVSATVKQLSERYTSMIDDGFSAFIDVPAAPGSSVYSSLELEKAFNEGRMEFTLSVFNGETSWLSTIPLDDMKKMYDLADDTTSLIATIRSKIAAGVYAPGPDLSGLTLSSDTMKAIRNIYSEYVIQMKAIAIEGGSL